MRKIGFLLTIVILYSFTENNSHVETSFSKTCNELADNFRKNEHGNLVFNQTSKKFVQPKDFANIMQRLSKYDLEEKKDYNVENVTLENIEKIIWRNKTLKNDWLERKIFKSKVYEKQSLVITEYTISRKEKPNYIRLRLIEDVFEELIVDKTKYSPFFESRLVDADEAVDELNKLEK